jgi:hypothetical protein
MLAIDEQMMFLALAAVGIDINSSRVAVFAPPKNGVSESSDVTGPSCADTSGDCGVPTVCTSRVANMSRIPICKFSQCFTINPP